MKKTLQYFAGFVIAFSIPVTASMIYFKVPVVETGGWYGLVAVASLLVTIACEPWEKT